MYEWDACNVMISAFGIIYNLHTQAHQAPKGTHYLSCNSHLYTAITWLNEFAPHGVRFSRRYFNVTEDSVLSSWRVRRELAPAAD